MMRGRGKTAEEEEMLPLSDQSYYSCLSAQTPEGAKPRRRRRKRKEEACGGMGRKKRKLSDEQVKFLEMSFGCEHKLESARKDRLAAELGLDPRQVAVWFQNRRARWKSKQLEGEYSRLKTNYGSTLLEKCRLEAEVCELKEQLVEAEKEIQRLSGRGGEGAPEGEGLRHCSPSTSLSAVETYEHVHFDQVGGFGVDDNFLFMTENAYAPTFINGVEWMLW